MTQLPHVVDCHAHLSEELLGHDAFGFDRILARCERYGVKAVVYSLYVDPEAAKLELPLEPIEEVARRHNSVHVGISVGLCPPVKALPSSVLKGQLDQAKSVVGRLAADGRIVAIGEVGLDYFWPIVEFLQSQGVGDWNDINREINTNRQRLVAEPAVQDCLETQAVVFRKCIKLAGELDLPLVVHGRDAYDDILSTLAATDLGPERVMLHCFAGTVDEAIMAAERGHRISVPSSVGYRTKFVDVAKGVDLASLVIETDSPYHSPMIGHWKAAAKRSQALTPPGDLTKKMREEWIREKRSEEFLKQIDPRYPGLEFTVRNENTPSVVPAVRYLSNADRRRENESTFVRCAATEIAELKDVRVGDVCEATAENARCLFPALF